MTPFQLTTDGVTITINDELLAKIEKHKKQTLPIIERIKSYEDACEEQNLHPLESLPFKKAENEYQDWINSCHELYVVRTSLMEGNELDWKDSDVYKYYPYFDMSGAFSFCDTNYDFTYSCAAARLCVDTEAKARHFGNSPKFTAIWKRYHGHKN